MQRLLITHTHNNKNVNYDTTLFQEEPSQDLKDWVNVIAANKDWEKSNKADAIKTLIKAYQNDEVAQIIYDASNKVDLPAWKVPQHKIN